MKSERLRCQFILWMTLEQRRRLDALSRELGKSRSEILRLVLDSHSGINPTAPVAEAATPE